LLYLYKSNSNSRSNSDSSANCRGNHRKTVFIRLFLGELFQLRSLENKLSYRKRFQGVFQHAPVKLRRVCAADIRTVAVKLVDLRAGVSGFAAYRKAYRGFLVQRFVCEDNVQIAVFIGPEGGFEDEEVELARENGAEIVTLGKRILRTETAGLCMLSALMLQLEV